ncbi:probable 2-oxoglutarate-dependent dioxygenase SLC1 [Beta vulgaris subsp. vulgaris]|uniref:probable 2-oxoglutarate-dependent dioxygenase SLC1 n=1 Tax=Beta vulgaris subsp. vulgaris TaxID=3555 RepID=UPI002036DC3C|nr:probable 2-oxoglutarate-dependent dioxygenase SLC1 [Beta vulgaris subsp. vulgaris]
MSPAISLQSVRNMSDSSQSENEYQKGVKHLYENGIQKVPNKYIFPILDRPNTEKESHVNEANIKLPIIDFAELQGANRSQVLKDLTNACAQYGFFQVVNHGVPIDGITSMTDACKRFFELPFEERAKYMSADMKAPVRYGTSFSQNKDGVYCWRDFLKLVCHPVPDVLSNCPSSPEHLRKQTAAYSKETRNLFLMLMEAILESLGLWGAEMNITEENDILEEFEDGSQIIVTNCYPPCPEPELTLGMPPHSDYGFLTLLLQDEVKGLQIQFEEKWLTVEPIPNAFVVNIGDHLEIFSNGRYKSVLHRVLVNQEKTRVTVASLHSLPFERVIRPSPKLINKHNPTRYKDTDFATFLEYISSCEPKKKAFLESRKLS